MNLPLDQWNGSKSVVEGLERIEKRQARMEKWMLVVSIVSALAAVLALWPMFKS